MNKKKKDLQHILCLIDCNTSKDQGTLIPLHTTLITIICFIFGLLFTMIIIFMAMSEGAIWILTGFVPLLFFVVVLMIIVKTKRRKKEIFLWLDDMIEYPAKAETIQSHRNWNPLDSAAFGTTSIIIQINFEYQGNSILLYVSGTKSLYTQYVKKCTNKEIRILYSPKYNKIPILKDDSSSLISKRH